MGNDVGKVAAVVFVAATAMAACGGSKFVSIGEGPGDSGGAGQSEGGATGEGGGTSDGGPGAEAGGGHPDSGAAGDSAASADAEGGTIAPEGGSGGPETGTDGPVFDPGSVSGLVLWLDAAHGVTKSGGNVEAWADRTANHNNATQTVAAQQPTPSSLGSGLPAVHFDATGGSATAGDMLSISDSTTLQWGTGDFYVGIVARFDNTLANGPEQGVGLLFGKTQSTVDFPGPSLTANIVGAISSSQTGLGFSTSAAASNDWVTTSTPYNDDTLRLYAMQRVGLTLDLRVGGASVGTSTSSGIDVSSVGVPVSIGAEAGGQAIRLDGDIAEIVAVKGVLSASDRGGLEGYLTSKYGL